MRITALLTFLSLTACQIPYLINNSYEQIRLLNNRVSVEKVLADPKTDAEVKRKLTLAQDALKFGVEKLGLAPHKNYRSYVDLKRPYVTWIVQVAPAYEVKPHLWWFPIVGSLPYKGFFDEQGAKDEAAQFDSAKFDKAVRGVSAYSTLGWFHDPILSSMLRYDDEDLVNVILHESVHATVFIPDHADFNERMANFFGNLGTQLFYEAREGINSKTAEQVRLENEDRLIFSKWISRKIIELNDFYKSHQTPEDKDRQLKALQQEFVDKLVPQLKTTSLSGFSKQNLNNAVLLNYTTYDQDLSDFSELHERIGDYSASLRFLKNLAKEKDPQQELKTFLAR